MLQKFRKSFAPVAVLVTGLAVEAQAALPSYATAAITDVQSQLTDLVGAIVPAAVALVLLALTPGVLIKMMRKLGSKVSF